MRKYRINMRSLMSFDFISPATPPIFRSLHWKSSVSERCFCNKIIFLSWFEMHGNLKTHQAYCWLSWDVDATTDNLRESECVCVSKMHTSFLHYYQLIAMHCKSFFISIHCYFFHSISCHDFFHFLATTLCSSTIFIHLIMFVIRKKRARAKKKKKKT